MEKSEIKFRGIRTEKNEWAYGSLISKKGYSAIIIFDDGIDSVYDTYLELRVIPETVGQFTGLKDKNGNEIYEGNILRWFCGDEEIVLGPVRWRNEISCWGTEIVLNTIEPEDLWVDGIGYEIKGNIHQNPELLK